MFRKGKIVFKGQLLTLAVVAFSMLTYCSPFLSGLFVYHRHAVINGEIWRLFTAPFVHFSFSHIFWDTLVFGIAGFAVSACGFPRFWLVCGLAAFIPGLLYLQAFPDLEYYGGLSGLATGSVAYFCLCNIFLTDRRKYIWILMLAVIGVKIVIEAVLNEPVFAGIETVEFVILPSAHIVGCLGAAASIVPASPRCISTRMKR